MTTYDKPVRDMLRFEVNVVEHCNLNCVGCDHFSPIAEKIFHDLDKYTNDLKRLAELFDGKASHILLLGGEPLLHPQLEDFVKVTRQYFPETALGVYTNGLLLTRMPESFWETLRDNKSVLIITNYPIKIDNDKIRELGEKYGIPLDYAWDKKIKTMNKMVIDPEGTGHIGYNFKKCHRANGCIMLQDGKLFTCTVAPTAHHLNKRFDQNLELSEDDYIDIYTAGSGAEILEKLSKPIPFCRYCDMRTRIKGITWKPSEKKLTEWFLTPEEIKKRDRWRSLRKIFGLPG